MKTFTYLIFLLQFCFINCYSQNSYRTVNSKANPMKVEMLYPPNTNLKYKGGILKSKYNYQYIKISGLSNDYKESIDKLNNAKYAHSKKDQLSGVSNISGLNFCKLLISKNGSCNDITIQIDYSKFLAATIEDDFNKLAIKLLIEISGEENTAKANLPKSISQNTLEKVFELIPIPQEASLARYAFKSDTKHSFVLLNPKIWLEVDATERSRVEWKDKNGAITQPDGIATNEWQMNYYGKSLIKFYRDKDGMFKQSPFLKLDNSKLNDNYTNDNHFTEKSNLQASSADIQLSNSTNKKRYFFLFQGEFKGNNSLEENVIDKINGNADRNSQLLFTDQLNDQIFLDLQKDEPAKKNKTLLSSSFGARNLITPVIPVTINGNEKMVNLNSTIDILKQNGDMPSINNFKIYRIFKGKYCKVKFINDTFILLPNDKIIF